MEHETIDDKVPAVNLKEKKQEFSPHEDERAERVERSIGTAGPAIRFIDEHKKDNHLPPEKQAAKENAKLHKSEEEIACYNGVVHNSNMAV